MIATVLMPRKQKVASLYPLRLSDKRIAAVISTKMPASGREGFIEGARDAVSADQN